MGIKLSKKKRMKIVNLFAFSAFAKKQNEDRLISGRSPLSELTQITDSAISWFQHFYGDDHVITIHWSHKITRQDSRMRKQFELCMKKSRSRREVEELSEEEINERDGEAHQDVEEIWERYTNWAVQYLTPICEKPGTVEKVRNRAEFWSEIIQKRLTRYRNRHGVN